MKEGNKIIYFIIYGEKLRASFFSMSVLFSRYGFDLVPVGPKDFPQLMNSNKHHVVSLIQNMRDLQMARQFGLKFLNHFILRRKIVLYELSSFENSSIHSISSSNKHYHLHLLPESMEFLVKNIIVEYYNQSEEVRSWPGGRRAKLPTI